MERNIVGWFGLLGFFAGIFASMIWWGIWSILSLGFLYCGFAGAVIGVVLGVMVNRRM